MPINLNHQHQTKMEQFRIAVLECDTPIDAIKKSHGTYGNIIKQLMQNSLSNAETSSARIKPIFTSWDVVGAKQYPKFEDVDALILSGSKYNAFDNDDWILQLLEFVRTFHEIAQKPVVGICFGHQIVARALGGQVQRNPGSWEVAVNTVNLSAVGKQVFGRDSLALHQMHRDAVLSLPPGCQSLGSSPACEIQGIYLQHRILTVQAHPEFDKDIMTALLESRHELGVFDDDVFEEAFSRASVEHDGLFVASVVWNFLLDK